MTYVGTMTPSTVGQFTISNLPFTPSMVKIRASGMGGVLENDQMRYAEGTASDNYCAADAVLVNQHYPKGVTREYRDSDTCFALLGTPGGNLERYIRILHVSFGTNSWTFEIEEASNLFQLVVEFYE